jgi:hypothetical protein
MKILQGPEIIGQLEQLLACARGYPQSPEESQPK